MKKIIILLTLVLLTSCGSYQISTLGHTPIRKTRVIPPSYTTPWYYGLNDPYWRWNYYQYFNTPTVIVVKPQRPISKIKGRRGPSINRGNTTRSNSTPRRNTNKRN
jgi:hypothetical protein